MTSKEIIRLYEKLLKVMHHEDALALVAEAIRASAVVEVERIRSTTGRRIAGVPE